VTEPTGREFDMLRDQVRANQLRLNDIDDHGTKGVASLQVQLTELVKDVLELKGDMNTRFTSHEKVHETDVKNRVSGRRWLIGTGIAGILSLATVVGLLFDILTHIH
jgi:hypothetical protein